MYVLKSSLSISFSLKYFKQFASSMQYVIYGSNWLSNYKKIEEKFTLIQRKKINLKVGINYLDHSQNKICPG